MKAQLLCYKSPENRPKRANATPSRADARLRNFVKGIPLSGCDCLIDMSFRYDFGCWKVRSSMKSGVILPPVGVVFGRLPFLIKDDLFKCLLARLAGVAIPCTAADGCDLLIICIYSLTDKV